MVFRRLAPEAREGQDRFVFERWSMKRKHDSAKGSAIIEFAFVLPVLLILFFGIIEFSVALYDKAIITNASREGARAGILYTGAGNAPVTDAQIIEVTQAYCADNMITFQDDAAPVVTVTRSTSPNFPQQLVTVDVSYDYTGLGLGQLLSAMGGPISIGASTTMKME